MSGQVLCESGHHHQQNTVGAYWQADMDGIFITYRMIWAMNFDYIYIPSRNNGHRPYNYRSSLLTTSVLILSNLSYSINISALNTAKPRGDSGRAKPYLSSLAYSGGKR